MRIVYWNILQGGGRRRPRIAEAILDHRPDVAVLGEFRSATGPVLLAALDAGCLTHQRDTGPVGLAYGQAAASRMPLADGPSIPDPRLAPRWLELSIGDVAVLCVNVPSQAEGVAKRRFWQRLLSRAEAMANRPFVIVGDFNSGAPFVDEEGRVMSCAAEFAALSGSLTEVWRAINGSDAREYTWFPSPHRDGTAFSGFRIDHAFVSPPLLDRLDGCRCSHAERLERTSDHSLLILDLKL
jgi:exonuclease III